MIVIVLWCYVVCCAKGMIMLVCSVHVMTNLATRPLPLIHTWMVLLALFQCTRVVVNAKC